MLSSSPVNAVRDHAADIPGWYDEMRVKMGVNAPEAKKTQPWP